MIDEIQLFIEVSKLARPTYVQPIKLDSLDIPLSQTELDSLDALMIGMYLWEIYGIDEELSKQFAPIKPKDYFDFCAIHKTKEPTSIKEAIDAIK